MLRLARCSSQSGPQYELFAHELEGDSISEAFRWRPDDAMLSKPSFARKRVRSLVETGEVTTTGFSLAVRNSVRGEEFTEPVFESYDASNSDLIPDPPFDYYRYANGDDDSVYFEAKAERGPIETRTYKHTVEPVAESKREYEQYLRNQVLATDFGDENLSEGVREIVDELVSSQGLYRETAELSKSYRTVLRRLGLADVELPDESEKHETHGSVYFAYDGQWYSGELSVYYR